MANATDSLPADSFTEQAYIKLKERILRGRLPLGAALSRRKLAQEFGMSLSPISEAIRRLEEERLLESRPRAGTRVKVPTAQEVEGMYVVRAALETMSARLCCERATEQERRDLKRAAERVDALFKQAMGSGRDAEFLYAVHSLHFDLHHKIAEYGRCPQLLEAIEKNHILLLNWYYDVALERREWTPMLHIELLAVITGRDPVAAANTMYEHVQLGWRRIAVNMPVHQSSEWRLHREPKRKAGSAGTSD